MPSIPLRIPSSPSSAARTNIPTPTTTTTTNALPTLLHTPTGLALLELQGTIHFPIAPSTTASPTQSTIVGKLVFPLYNPAMHGEEDTKWMKRVYFYVGRNQRMTGEVKKLGRPFAVVRRQEGCGQGFSGGNVAMGRMEEGVEISGRGEGADGEAEGLEIVDVVKYKVVFSARPEPVGGGEGEGD